MRSVSGSAALHMARVADQQTAAAGADNVGIGLAGRRRMRERHRETWLPTEFCRKMDSEIGRKLGGCRAQTELGDFGWAVVAPSPECDGQGPDLDRSIACGLASGPAFIPSRVFGRIRR